MTYYPKLRKRAKKLGAMIFFPGRGGVSIRPAPRPDLRFKGAHAGVAFSGQRQSINVISAVNASGAFWAATYTGKLNAESFLEFSKGLYEKPDPESHARVDGHPAHKANLIKNYIATLDGRLELHFLPPYAPDLNPDEFVWNYMKGIGVSKKPLKKNESLRERVEQDLNTIHRDKALVASFFLAASVAYAND